ncbi:hypothetical protein [Hoeflea sp.]|uniref:hypothetical protein n=1 Tax=Hoeflea sp. TaxID=1940281 RepID=UPI003B5160CB
MAQTTHFSLEKPDEERDVDEEFTQLQTTLDSIDQILKNLSDGISGKASSSHSHAIGDVTGLSSALEGKMPASATFALDNLTDVSGAAAAANGYVLVKSPAGWIPSSPAAAMGEHGHTIAQITGLTTALNSKADATTMATALAAKADASSLGSIAASNITVSASAPSGGTNGDLWFVV